MATLSGLNLRYLSPLICPPPPRLSSGFLKCEYRIFSANVNLCDLGSTCRTSSSVLSKRGYGGVIELHSFTASPEGVAKDLLNELAVPLGRIVDLSILSGALQALLNSQNMVGRAR